jgi:4-amino-4-deoxy-L-arabinose transferase
MKAVDKTMLMGYLFLMGITASSTYFFGNNSKIVNDPKNVASFIKNELPDVGSIIIYDRRMPSMAFLTDKKIISIYDGSEDLNRETQFEKDELWKTNLINLKVETDWLITKKPVNAVLMVKKNKAEADPIKEAAKRFERKKEIDGWVLFY